MNTLTMIAAATLSLVSLGAAAQTTSTPRIDERQTNQEARIDRGIASGELTNREVRRLEHEQHVINRYENKAKADGKVTAKERKRLTHAQHHASQDIYRQKHDRQDR
jgi:capsular polysaccharide biosynthesis protein